MHELLSSCVYLRVSKCTNSLKLQMQIDFHMNSFLPDYLLRKILVAILLVVLCSQVFAQKKFDDQRSVSVPDNRNSNAALQSASILKMNVFAPLLGYSQFSWEKYIRNNRSLELGLGIIGAGKNLHIEQRAIFSPDDYRHGHKNQFGGFFELGYKFVKRSKAMKKSSKSGIIHSFEGAYLKPSLVMGTYNFNQFSDNSTFTKIRRHHNFGALLINVGGQWAISSRLVFDTYIGGGAEVDNVKFDDDLYGHPFVLVVAKDNPSLNFAFTAGFLLGFLLN